MKTYTLFWLTWRTELVKGNTPEEAMTLAGYGGGAVRALDFFGNGDIRDDYKCKCRLKNLLTTMR